MNIYFSNDDRSNYAYAMTCGLRRWRWLFKKYPQDFKQTVSLVCCEYKDKTVTTSRAISRAMYALARNNGFYRPASGLVRGKTGKWKEHAISVQPDRLLQFGTCESS